MLVRRTVIRMELWLGELRPFRAEVYKTWELTP